MPFIANDGQTDEKVRFYAKTFGGTVFVTKEGAIVYALPNNSSELGVESLRSDVRSQRLEDGRQEAEARIHTTIHQLLVFYARFSKDTTVMP